MVLRFVVWHGKVWHDIVWYGDGVVYAMMWYGMVVGMVRCGIIIYGVVW